MMIQQRYISVEITNIIWSRFTKSEKLETFANNKIKDKRVFL